MKNVDIDVLRLSCLHMISGLFLAFFSACLTVGSQSDLYEKAATAAMFSLRRKRQTEWDSLAPVESFLRSLTQLPPTCL